MTQKENIIPGRKVMVSHLNGGGVNDHLVIMPEHGDGLRSFRPSDGMVLTILSKAKKDKNGINCVKIGYEGEKIGYAYYTHIRYCTFEI